jgi:uncharacterized iron-regulated protein
MKLRALALLALLAAACGHRFDPRLVDVPIAGRPWVSTEDTKHPLAGKIWEPRAGRFVDEAALTAALTSADYVFLGEVHDNPDHHLLQARLLRAITASGRRPALGFEMLDGDKQKAVDTSLAAAPKDPDALGKAVGWDQSGWPEFKLYRPIFAAGLEAGLPIVATNLSRAQLREVRKQGRSALSEQVRTRLAREEPLPASVVKALRAEMEESHCGSLPDAMVDPLVLSQRARNAEIAVRLEGAAADRGGVLVTGKAHARTDRGVPAIVARDLPGKKIVTVAFTEVQPDETDPATYKDDEEDAGPAPWDFVVFTPGAEREDPCVAFRAHMKKRAEAAAKGGGKDAKPEAPKDPPAAPPAGAAPPAPGAPAAPTSPAPAPAPAAPARSPQGG